MRNNKISLTNKSNWLSIFLIACFFFISGCNSNRDNANEIAPTPSDAMVLFSGEVTITSPTELYRTSVEGVADPIQLSDTGLADGEAGVIDFKLSPNRLFVAFRVRQTVIGSTPEIQKIELFVVSVDGGTATKVNAVLTDIGFVSQFRWAPDSSSIAYLADQDTAGVNELYVSQIDGSGNTKINAALVAGGDVATFKWAPDSSRIAYLADQDVDGKRQVYTSLTDGSGNIAIDTSVPLPGGNSTAFEWSPNGSNIAFINSDNLYISTPDGSTVNKINQPPLTGPGAISWAPDSSAIAYLAHETTSPNNSKVFASNIDGSSTINVQGSLVTDLVDPSFLAFQWSPDSSSIGFTAKKAGYKLYVRQLSASEPVEVSGVLTDGREVEMFSWAPNSNSLAYQIGVFNQFTDQEILTTSLLPSTDAPVSLSSPSDGNAFGFRWSPDSSRIAFIVDASPTDIRLHTSTPDGSESTLISSSLAFDSILGWYRWTPDSNHIVYSVADSGLPTNNKEFELRSSSADGLSDTLIAGNFTGGITAIEVR